ncbi:hypothetical protein BJY04DRAFT_139095 [Aspergillus karnatakaensis]|uniref:uncharacterized protein n=1 Tax=Aspergillus karnatakaensis TaxID=1810916 RepID=UPI003CCD9FBA
MSGSLHTYKAHATTAAAAGGTVYAANQLIKAFDDDDEDSTPHLLKAGVGAAVAIGALEMLRKDDDRLSTYRRLLEKKYDHHSHSHADDHAHHHTRAIKSSDITEEHQLVTTGNNSHQHSHDHGHQHGHAERKTRQEAVSNSSSRSSSASSFDEKGHKRRLAEELVGAYALGKQLLGDDKHKVMHLVMDAVGAAGLLKEIKLHDLRNK